MKRNNRTLLFLLIIFFFVFIGISGTILYLQRSKPDADISAILRQVGVSNPTKQIKNFSKSPIQHVFVIVEENRDWTAIYGNPDALYINKTLLTQGSYASNYHNVPKKLDELHPSELNYLFMEAGMIAFPDHTFSSNDSPSAKNSTASKNHLITLLEKKGYTWKSYQEDISGKDCPIHTIKAYAPKHNPFIFFQDVSGNPPSTTNKYCIEHVRPLSELQKDLATGNVPNYVFITPNLQHDMHDGTVKKADSWLSEMVPQITNSTIFKKNGALFITWDEGFDEDKSANKKGNNPIGMIILSPYAKTNYTNSTSYSHASLLKTIQEIFGLTPLLGYANDPETQDLFDFFQKPY